MTTDGHKHYNEDLKGHSTHHSRIFKWTTQGLSVNSWLKICRLVVISFPIISLQVAEKKKVRCSKKADILL